MSNPSITVAIVEDDPRSLSRFEQAVKDAGDLVLLASFCNGRDAQAWLASHAPDVLLVDLGLPDIPGLSLITFCKLHHPATDVMVVTMYEDEAHVVKCLEAGAGGYLLKDSLREEIASHIRELRAGGAPMTPVVARQVIKRFRERGQSPAEQAASSVADSPLTEREQMILTRIAQGFSYVEIAGLLGLSRHTVHTHIKRIYSKLAVHSRSEAIFEANQMGLLPRVAVQARSQ